MVSFIYSFFWLLLVVVKGWLTVDVNDISHCLRNVKVFWRSLGGFVRIRICRILEDLQDWEDAGTSFYGYCLKASMTARPVIPV